MSTCPPSGDVSMAMQPGAAQTAGLRKPGRTGTLQGLLIGAVGGATFNALGLPAPWISGAMLAVAGAMLAGVRVGMIGWLRQLAFYRPPSLIPRLDSP